MSLSQATSPEEAKRELKQQVFLAIQGKYDHKQTTLLIKDIDTITNAITAVTANPAQVAEDNTNTYLFLGGDIDGEDRQMNCDTKGMPLAVECYPSDSKDTYYRNSMEVGFSGFSEESYYFYTLKKDYIPSSDKAAVQTTHKLISFEQAKK